ncbi:RICIN domain-containing protein [Streptosporangium sp. NPDC049644]|uniref:RICIN domain-containing protein n=1 Tax=Streptosporangium sp. NPDC049644 TaxID=3155507 RepID=UPI0034279F2C
MRLFHAGQVFVLAAALLAAPSAGWASAGEAAGVREGFRARFTAILVARHSDKCLDVFTLSDELKLGTSVQQWPCSDDHDGQVWNLTATGGGYYNFRDVASGLCMEVVPTDRHSGAGLQLWTCVPGHRNQEWKLVQRDNGYFAVVVRHTGMCLDVRNALLRDGANVRQVTCVRGRKNQEWRLA